MKKLSLIAVCALAFLTACGDAPAPQDIVDGSMTITRLNAQKNANSYMGAVYPSGTVDAKLGTPMRALAQSDSTVRPDCRYGDGWATAEIQFEGGKKLVLKCQTNGVGKGINGCMTQAEFQSKTYKDEEGSCQNLTKLEKF